MFTRRALLFQKKQRKQLHFLRVRRFNFEPVFNFEKRRKLQKEKPDQIELEKTISRRPIQPPLLEI